MLRVKAEDYEVDVYEQTFDLIIEEASELKFAEAISSYESVIANVTAGWYYLVPELDESLEGQDITVTVEIPGDIDQLVAYSSGELSMFEIPEIEQIGSYDINFIIQN